ncbi:MAG: beta-galactosidase [Stellaceae bacterium]
MGKSLQPGSLDGPRVTLTLVARLQTCGAQPGHGTIRASGVMPDRCGAVAIRAAVLLGALLAASPAAADALWLSASVPERMGLVPVEYILDRRVTGTTTVTIEWTDSYGRLIEHRVMRRDLDNTATIGFSIDLRRAVAMQNRLHATCSISGADAGGEPDQHDGQAAINFIARPEAHVWRDYQIIMWQPQTPARLAGLVRLGVSAGRIMGMRGAFDPAQAKKLRAPFLALNLRWFVENIATDFYSAYHCWFPDRPVNWLFERARKLYRQDPQGRAAFIRTPSLSDPAWLHRIAARLYQHVRAYRAYRPLYYNLADKPGIADLAVAWDFDFSPASLAGFRVWLKGRYGTRDALNREWVTNFARWRDVMPMTTDEALKRDDGNFAAWADFKAWMDVAFARAVQAGTGAIHAADPQARSALEGAQPPGWGGYNYGRLARSVDVMEMYDHADNVAISEALNPRLIVLSTSSLAGPQDLHSVWQELLRGEKGLILWDEYGAFIDDDGSATPRGTVLAALARELRSGLAAQWLAARPLDSPVAILYSPASYRTQWLLDRKAAGGDWTKRGSASEYEDDTQGRAATRRAMRLMRRLTLTPRWVTRTTIAAGALRSDGIRFLILPDTIALSQQEAVQIRDYVARGNRVIADTEPGIFDAHSRRLPHPLIAGLTNRDGLSPIAPVLQAKQAPDDPRPLTAMAKMLAAAGVTPRVAVTKPDGSPTAHVAVYVRQSGDVTLLGLQREWPQSGKPSLEQVVLRLPQAAYIIDLRHRGTGDMRNQCDRMYRCDRPTTVDCSRSASKAIFAFRNASIFRLVFFIIRSVYHDGTAHAPSTPPAPNPESTSKIDARVPPYESIA